MKTIGVFANCEKPLASEVLRRLAAAARQLGLQLVADSPTADLLPGVERRPAAEMTNGIDALLVFGGDGTMLRAVRLLQGSNAPVLGVNLGGLGFLTSLAHKDLESALACLAQGRLTTSRRFLIDCRVIRADREISHAQALNDVVIDRGATTRIVTLDMRIDREEVSSFMCDGLIISTPTGSTGHSLSTGGPVLHPETGALVISLICPHTLSTRPLVIPDHKRITVTVAKSLGDILLSVDGQANEPLKPADQVVVQRSPTGVAFIQLPDYSYFSVLRQKLHWRGSALA